MIKTLFFGWLIFIIALLVGAYGVLYYESQCSTASINTYEDALWWSINVSSAVGDCNICPKTTGGRIVSTILMFIGYALFSINIAGVITFFKEKVNHVR